MYSLERRRQAPDSDSDVTSTAAEYSSGSVPPTGSSVHAGDTQQVPGLRLIDGKSGGGWALGPSYPYLPSQEEQVRTKANVNQTLTGEQRSSSAGLPSGSGQRHPNTAAFAEAGNDGTSSGEVAPSLMYISPSQDMLEDDDNTFVDHGSTTAASNANAGGPSPGAAAAAAAVSASLTKKTTSKPRAAIVAQVGSPTPYASTTAGASPSGTAAHTNGRGAVSNSAGGDRVRGGLSLSPSLALLSGGAAAATSSSPMHASAVGGGVPGSSPPPPPLPTPPQRSSVGPSAYTNSGMSAARRSNGAGANTSIGGGNADVLGGGATPQYSRMNSNEAVPGVVYRATVPSNIRAMAVDPVEPVVWTAVGDDPLAALRLSGRELTHSKSVKDIDQVHCMAVVRIAEEQATTFKSASTSPRAAGTTPKAAKAGKRKKGGRSSSGVRKSGKQRAGSNGVFLGRSLASGLGGEDDVGNHGNSDDDGYGDDVMTSGSPLGHDKQGVSFSNYLWCGLSRGHVAVVNMSNLEYQLIHNAHNQTVNKIWYWEACNKVWTAGREKGVHVWDPQRRAVLKRRNIAAILSDATYAESTDKVFAVAGDACVRVFEPSGENVNVPKGQENRIRMKLDASVIEYHRNSGFVWVGLARGSALMNTSTLDVERTLPYTFSAILFKGNNAIIAGQESPSGEGRLMVLDVTNPKEPSVLAYSKFAGALPLGLHIVPRTRFAVAAQDDPKKGCMMAVFVYDGTVALMHATASGGAPPQRTEWVPRGAAMPTTVGTPSPPAQPTTQAPDQSGGSNAITATTTSPAVSNVTYSAATVATVDRATLHRGAVVKTSPDYRTDRKLAVEADRSSLVEAIAPDAQDIKNALKHLVKTTDEVRQSLVQQRSAESTLADFSRVLRGRQQWLLEQGSITNLPVLPSAVADRIDRDYATAEGKTIATSIEQLQQLYTAALAKQQELLHSREAGGGGNESGAVALSLPAASSPRELRMSSSAVATSPLAPGSSAKGWRGDALGSGVVGGDAAALRVAAGSGHHHPGEHLVEGDSLPYVYSPRQSGVSASGPGAGDAAVPPWALQLASTLRRERTLHAQQLNALQLQAERLAERNTALSAAFVRLQAHVAALGQQALASVMDAESTGSVTVESEKSPPSFPLQRRQPFQAHQPYQPSPQHRSAAALFAKLSHGQYHKPKCVRRSTDVLVKAMDEVVRLAQSRRGRSGDRDALGITLEMVHSMAGLAGTGSVDDPDGSADTAPAHTRPSRIQDVSLSPSSPSMVLPLEAPLSAEEVVATRGVQGNSAAVDDTLLDHPLTSLPGVCSMAEVELRNLTERDAEVASLWARLQSIRSQPRDAGASHHTTEQHATPTGPAADVTADNVKVVEGGLLLRAPIAGSTTDSSAAGSTPALLTQLMTARVLQAVCWAECVQTVLHELTHAEGMDNIFIAGCVHNALMSPRATAVGRYGDGASAGVRGQGPLEVLGYESTQEQSMVLAKVGHMSKSATLELSNTSRVREGLRQQEYRSQDEEGTSGVAAFANSDFRLHRLPGALRWSLTALRLLFAFLSDAEAHLLVSGGHGGGSDTPKVDARTARAAGKHKAGVTPSSDEAAATRAPSAVGVAMTHWAMFLMNLQADLTAVHHAARLYHAWLWGPSALSATAAATTPSNRAGGAVHNRSGAARGGGIGVSAPSKATPYARESASIAASTTSDSLAHIAASLSSKGKLLLLYMQWRFSGFATTSTDRAVASTGGANVLSGSANAASSSLSSAGLPTLFTSEGDNDIAASTAAVTPCSAADCSRLLCDTVAQTKQLLHRVRLLLAYTHAIRARALMALEESRDEAVAQVIASFASTAAADPDARVPTEQERAFLQS
ncbi:hypothetical protein LdCL_130010100 [Leishmania donovani]|uniref:Uncharacterized protein n=1 Tax=Leishmania donovani TaxID=5661 RepID=A0A3S7WSD1_LEIDO|nr:hypothetical protein LdCL_130010100 [Leishmania donovani]